MGKTRPEGAGSAVGSSETTGNDRTLVMLNSSVRDDRTIRRRGLQVIISGIE